MTTPTGILWLGTEQAYTAYEDAVARYEAAGAMSADGLPTLLEQHGDVGVVHVSGPLIAGEAGFLRYFGVTGYDDIANAMLEAVANPEINSIVLSAASGGGEVTGVQDLSDLLANIDQVKPLVTHTSSNMLSAMYWLGVAGRKVFATQLAELGSIGVLMIHAERSKQLLADGVTVNVIRAGKYKALANPYEPLPDVAKADMQAKVDLVHGLFQAHVADRRGMKASQVDKIGQGQVYQGQKAVDLGLADTMGTLLDAIAYARSEGLKNVNLRVRGGSSVDKRAMAADNSQQHGTKDMNLTPAQLSAIASGLTMQEALNLPVVAAATDPVEPAAAANPVVEPTEPVAAVAAVEEVKTDVLAFVQTQLAAANDALLAEKVKTAQLDASLADVTSAQEGLLAVVRASLSNMSIALNGSGDVGAGLSATGLLAEHSRVAEVFTSKYKTGGVAAANAGATPAAKPKANPMFAHLSRTAPNK